MSLPLSRNTDYSTGTAPKIKATDLNDLQDGIVDHESQISGGDFHFEDDFTGADVSTGKWASDSVSGTGASSVTSDTGASGVYEGTATGGDGDGGISTVSLDVGLNNFRFVCRVKVHSIGGAGSTILFSLGSAANSLDITAVTGTNSGNWIARLGGVSHNTAVAPSGYQLLEFRRTDGVFEWLINGEQVYTETVALTITGALGFTWSRATSGTTTARVDAIKGRHRR